MHIITNLVGNAGAEIMLARLLRASTNERTLVVPLIDVAEQNRKRAQNPGVSFVPLHMHSALDAVKGTMKLAKLIGQEKPRVIVCWMYHAMIVGTIAQTLSRHKAPLYWNVRQSLDDPASLSRSTRYAVTVARLLSSLPSGTIYNSARALKLHGDRGYRNNNSIVIPNGFDIPAETLIESRVPTVFGIAGRFHPQKDYENFFRAVAIVARKYPQAKFKAAGNGVSSDNLSIEKMLLEVDMPKGCLELCGEISDMPAFYKSIDVFVLSSRTEGFPNVVAEAMSHGKPVITTNVGDAAQIVDSTGWVVPPRDSEALSSAMEEALNLPAEKYSVAAAGARQRIEDDFDLVSVKRRYENFLSSGEL